MNLVEKCKENLKLSEDLEIKDLVKYNPCIEKSVKRPIQRDNFYENIENLNFKNLVRKNLPKRSLIKKIINKIILILKNGKVK